MDTTGLIKTFLARLIVIDALNYIIFKEPLMDAESLKLSSVAAGGSMVSQYWVEPMLK